MRARVLVASVAVHGVLAALIVSLAVHPSPPSRSSVSIEVISATREPVAEPRRAPTPTVVAAVARAKPGSHSGSNSPGARTGADPSSDPRGEIRYESGDDGTGVGTGAGTGLGVGDSSSAAAVAALTPPPAPEPVKKSQARPAILVYPKKHGTEDDTAVFVAQVTIDDEGYVVGAHVMSGEGGSRGQQASNLIWRVRYDSARGEDGRPIRSTLEQPFLVGR
ncbi:hypothetical protein BH11MYX2_BH11MYX2_14850 [soil metagenome]